MRQQQLKARVIYGKKVRLPCDLVFNYADQLKERLLEILDLVTERISVGSDRMKTGGLRDWLYKPRRKKGISPKFTPSWEGPYTVI